MTHKYLELAHWLGAFVVLGCCLNQLHDIDFWRKRPWLAAIHRVCLALAWGGLGLGSFGTIISPLLKAQPHPTWTDTVGMTGLALIIVLRGLDYRFISKECPSCPL